MARSPEASRGNTKTRLRQQLLSLWEAPEESVGYRARNCHVSSWNGQKEEKVPQTKSAPPTDCNFFGLIVLFAPLLFNRGHHFVPTPPRSPLSALSPIPHVFIHDSSQRGLVFEPNVQTASQPLATGPCGHRERVRAAAGCPVQEGAAWPLRRRGVDSIGLKGWPLPPVDELPLHPGPTKDEPTRRQQPSAQVLMDQLVLPSRQALAPSKFCSCQPSLLS